jgi:hypothetical protein
MMCFCPVCGILVDFDTSNRFGGDLGSCTNCGCVYEMQYVTKQSDFHSVMEADPAAEKETSQ